VERPTSMMRTASRLIPSFVAAVLVLSACGSDDDSAGEATVPDAGSSVASSGSDDGLVAPRPIEVTGAGGNAGAEMVAESDRATSDAMIAPYQITTFVVGDGLPALPGNQIGFVFEAGATVAADQIDALAAALGVTGSAERIEDGYGSAWWRVGPEDGTAPSLTVYEDAQLSWYYSAAWAEMSVGSSGCAVAGSAGVDAPAVDPAADATSAPATTTMTTAVADMVCETPEPPAGILTAEQAEARTRELMTAIGLDPAGFTIEPYADEWYASATATEQLEGGFGGRRFDAGFGAEGVLQNAGGQLATPAQAGPYELIDLDAAIARLNDQSGFWGGYGGGIAVDAVARSADAAGAAIEPAIAPDIAEAPVSDAMPIESMPPAEPIEVTVTLVDVQADVWWVWDADGSVWLLPAYRFIGDDGGWYTVPAVADELLVQPPVPPTSIDTLPVPVDSEPPASVDSVPPATTPADSSALEAFVGTPLADFTKQAEGLGWTVRVVEQDGESLAATDDYITTRVNVAVEGDTVTRIVNVG
jgi:hypothetical protein